MAQLLDWLKRSQAALANAQLRTPGGILFAKRLAQSFPNQGRVGRFAMSRFSSIPFLGVAAFIAGTAFFTGCEKKGTSGGPGVTTTTAGSTTTTGSVTTTTVANTHETFKLTVPSGTTSVKQGESKTATIGVSRGRDFDQAVSLKFSGEPAGVKIDPPTPTIKSGEKETTVAIVPATDAKPGEYTITVTGHPASGEDSTADVTIKVEQK
jgi:hypothetical protein